ncbi:MAG: CPBP family intramembrane metalloprotease [Acidobacteriia bacterium]|nr:CPBP family intramembrane metalloprotease [Terriglobia bacterium]
MTTHGGNSSQAHDTAERLKGFGPLGLLSVVVILAGSLAGPPISAILVLAWAQISETPLRALGFTAPRSWTVTLVVGVAFGIAFKLGTKALVMPLLGAPPINVRYQYLTGNSVALPGIVAAVLISASFSEEVFFRGYLFERLGKLLGHGRAALVASVLLSAAVFAFAHYRDQRLPGVEQAAVTGLVFGGIFAWRRQIWLVMMAHAAFDLTAVALIYWNWEAPVAHLLFR